MWSLSSLHRHKKVSEQYVPLEGPYCHIAVIIHMTAVLVELKHICLRSVICDMLHHWASGSQHFKEMECHLRIMTPWALKMKAVCSFRTNYPTMQCPFQKTRILNYATEKISNLSAIYTVEQQGFQSKPRQFDKQYNMGWTGEESPSSC